MKRKQASGIVLTLIIVSMLMLTLNTHTAKAESNPEVTVSPSDPTTEDNVQVTLNFTFYNYPPYIADWGTPTQTDSHTIIIDYITLVMPSGIILPVVYTVSHTYNLGQLPAGTYHFEAYAKEYLEGPTEYFASITFTVTGAGDLNTDKRVDIKDLTVAGLAFGATPESPRWNPAADINRDNRIDIRDLILIAKNFGKTYP